jgi:hypothetical protein
VSGRKPTLGYPSRTEAVLALRKERLSTAAIAQRVGIEPKIVTALEASGKRSRELASDGYRTVLFPPDLLRRLRPFAVRRDVSVNELARRIIEAAVDDGIVDAVLDDCPEEAAA